MKKLYYLAFSALFTLCFSCRVSKQAFNPAQNCARAALRSDYQLFRHILEDLHPRLYWNSSRDNMNYFVDKGYGQLTDSMTETEFRVLLSYVIAKVDCRHTSLRYSKQYGKYLDTAKLPQFPLLLKFWKDTMVVVANLNRRHTLLTRGTIIESIDGWPPPRLRETLSNMFFTARDNLPCRQQY